MAGCKFCGKDMIGSTTCVEVKIKNKGKEYSPVKFGDEVHKYLDAETLKMVKNYEGPCGDCAVAKGGYHHPGCDMEECPVCGGQLISCSCDENAEQEDL